MASPFRTDADGPAAAYEDAQSARQDARLVKRVRAGDAEVYGELVSRYAHPGAAGANYESSACAYAAACDPIAPVLGAPAVAASVDSLHVQRLSDYAAQRP